MLGILSVEQIGVVSEFCKAVISQNYNVVFVCAINKNGRIIDMERKDNPELFSLTKHESEIVFMQRILQISMMRDLDEKLGRLSFAIMERDQFTECLFPFHDGAVIVFFDTTDVREHAAKIVSEIQNLDKKIKTTHIAC